jgi:hypothetical protein
MYDVRETVVAVKGRVQSGRRISSETVLPLIKVARIIMVHQSTVVGASSSSSEVEGKEGVDEG